MKRPWRSVNMQRTVSISPDLESSSSCFASIRPRSSIAPPQTVRARPVLGTAPSAFPPGLDALEIALDRREFLRRSLHLRALEPLPRRDEPVDAGESDDDEHRHRREVERVGEGDLQSARAV